MSGCPWAILQVVTEISQLHLGAQLSVNGLFLYYSWLLIWYACNCCMLTCCYVSIVAYCNEIPVELVLLDYVTYFNFVLNGDKMYVHCILFQVWNNWAVHHVRDLWCIVHFVLFRFGNVGTVQAVGIHFTPLEGK